MVLLKYRHRPFGRTLLVSIVGANDNDNGNAIGDAANAELSWSAVKKITDAQVRTLVFTTNTDAGVSLTHTTPKGLEF